MYSVDLSKSSKCPNSVLEISGCQSLQCTGGSDLVLRGKKPLLSVVLLEATGETSPVGEAFWHREWSEGFFHALAFAGMEREKGRGMEEEPEFTGYSCIHLLLRGSS